jgi:hypothetical protein
VLSPVETSRRRRSHGRRDIEAFSEALLVTSGRNLTYFLG